MNSKILAAIGNKFDPRTAQCSTKCSTKAVRDGSLHDDDDDDAAKQPE